MKKYALMAASAALIATAPAYYAFQANAEEAAPVATQEAAPSVDETAEAPATTEESAAAETPAAGEQPAAEESAAE